MSDKSVASSSHTKLRESVARGTTIDIPSQPLDPSLSLADNEIPVPGLGSPPSDEKNLTHRGILSSAQHAIHNATETIKHLLRASASSSP
jgi:hypothetical protein